MLYNIKLTLEEYNNLQIFLNRVELKGHEVPAFISIIKKVNDAEVDKDGK